MQMFENPFRPGAGHTPPYLAGREAERKEFDKLLKQKIILENMVLTGLRGVGKTVLLETFKPVAIRNKWLWVGTDLSESTSVSEATVAVRLLTDLSPVASSIQVSQDAKVAGFRTQTGEMKALTYQGLMELYDSTPGLSLDKLKTVLEFVWSEFSKASDIHGIIFAYDEAQNLADQAAKDEYPLSLMLDTFQSLQRQNLPLMLILTGLPTLFPKLVEARTFSERMFRVVFLQSLTDDESGDAILKPIEDGKCPVRLSNESVTTIVRMSGGYPYFIQFICKEVYDVFLQKIDKGESALVPVAEIEQKLDTDFFAERWARATDRQRALLSVIASLERADEEFTVQEIVEKSKEMLEKAFGSSHVNQMLAALTKQGLVFKNRHGRYSFAVPLLGRFIQRQLGE